MERIWAPWRMEYVSGAKKEQCIFCEAWNSTEDKAHYVLYRDDNTLALLNLFPYTNGHVMVCPRRHTGQLEALTPAEIGALMVGCQLLVRVMKRVLSPAGFNVGMNLGEAGGAGIADHLHMHIVPRWSGDTNFMPVIGDTKVIPQSLDDAYRVLSQELRDEMTSLRAGVVRSADAEEQLREEENDRTGRGGTDL